MSVPTGAARRQCSGCCFCRPAAPLPVYLQTRLFEPKPWSLGVLIPRETCELRPWTARGMWVTVDELRAWLGELARSRLFDAEPIYPICRRPELDGLGCYGRGCRVRRR